jgi:hypothetical protein
VANARQTKTSGLSSVHGSRGRKRRAPRLLVAAASGTAVASAGAFVFADELKHYYGVAERSSRVVNTLYINIRE